MITQDDILQARILIADDQRLHALFLKEVLQQAGYQHIECVHDPLKIQKTVAEFRPDLLVLDILMPQIDGFQVMRQLEEYRAGHYLPILALSADKGTELRLRVLQSGATDFLNKPYESLEAVIHVRNLIEMRLLHLAVENQNRLLEEKVQDRTRELRETQLDIIRRLAHAAEFRDNDTGIHIVRMSQYCAKFAEALGLSDAECELILTASPLHDIGKIGIPDRILLKPGRLTPEEFEVMKTHTLIGAQLLGGSESPLMKMAQTIALTHHEKWDGTGYPRQLKGDDIPLVGQLCSVCDVFDALTSERPYKKAWTNAEALAEISAQKGKHFSPRIAERFVEVFPEIERLKLKNGP